MVVGFHRVRVAIETTLGAVATLMKAVAIGEMIMKSGVNSQDDPGSTVSAMERLTIEGHNGMKVARQVHSEGGI